MLNRLLICTILLAKSSLLFSESTTKEIKLSFIKDINENFVSIVDNIIELEKKCDYYTDSLFFYISVIEYPEKSDSLYIDFDSNTNITDISNFKPIAFFRRNSHYFFVRGMISEKLFFLMDAPVVFSYKTIEMEEMEDLKIIDDSHSYWTYLFYNNKFYLLRTFSWCSDGTMLYAPGGPANTGIAPLNVNSTRIDIINAYPNIATYRLLPANFILRNLPNIYYKR